MHHGEEQKIGILTFHKCINYGSYWQARSLAEGLQSVDRTVSILDHHSVRVNIAEWKCAYQPVLPTPVPLSDRPLYRKKMKGFFKSFESLPLSAPFPLRQPERMMRYDTVVIGSDEVWNLFHPWFGGDALFFGEGVKANRLISYAATFGNYPATWGISEEWVNRLRHFDAISVRDENSYWLIRNELGTEPEIVLDPSLQFDITPDPRELAHLPDSYVAVYGHNFTTEYIQKVRGFASRKHIPLVSIGYRNDWADLQWLTADPHDFAHFMAGAAAVATNFFHGCAFAVKYQRPFACEASIYRSNKVQGLLTLLGAKKHLVHDGADIEHLMTAPIDDGIIQNIETLRARSTSYLQQALESENLKVA